MISRNKKKETLSDKIASIINTAPESFDPEDDIYVETAARVSHQTIEDDEDDEVTISQFRKQNVELLDSVDSIYKGKKVSRKSLYSEDDDESLDEEFGDKSNKSDEESVDESESDFDDDNEKEDDDADDEVDDQDDQDDNFRHMSETNTAAQFQKGNCVRNELKIWEGLLEMRIQLQKCVVASNRLPQHDIFAEYNTDAEFKLELSKTKKNVTNVLDKFLTLQELLLKQYPETKNLIKEGKTKTEDSDEEIPSDTEDEINKESEEEDKEIPKKRRKTGELVKTVENNFEKYKNYRNSVIQKWNDKTRLAVGKNNTAINSVLQQITYLLADKPRLLKRTQLKRSEYNIVGKTQGAVNTQSNETKPATNEYDAEIYDDDDFYHQLLRELIEHKSSDVTDPIQMSRNWIALQKYRSKIKRPMDIKATKGRRIRYDVHTKLVNYMAPIDNSTWTEEAKTELCRSLFGKG